MKQILAVCFGEFLGTFILVFFGTAIVAVALLFQAPVGLVQVALVWGAGVTLAIYATRHLSCAHLNPAVSLGMVLAGRMNPRLLLSYWAAQLVGAMAAGAFVLLVFHLGDRRLRGGERDCPWTRLASVKTAMMFGEYFPNPGIQPTLVRCLHGYRHARGRRRHIFISHPDFSVDRRLQRGKTRGHAGSRFYRHHRCRLNRRHRTIDADRHQPGQRFRPPPDRLPCRMGSNRHSGSQGRLFLGLHCGPSYGRSRGCRLFSFCHRPFDGGQDQYPLVRLRIMQ